MITKTCKKVVTTIHTTTSVIGGITNISIPLTINQAYSRVNEIANYWGGYIPPRKGFGYLDDGRKRTWLFGVSICLTTLIGKIFCATMAKPSRNVKSRAIRRKNFRLVSSKTTHTMWMSKGCALLKEKKGFIISWGCSGFHSWTLTHRLPSSKRGRHSIYPENQENEESSLYLWGRNWDSLWCSNTIKIIKNYQM